jgi:hypothetical protein
MVLPLVRSAPAESLVLAISAVWRMDLEERVRRANMIAVLGFYRVSLVVVDFVVEGAVGSSCCQRDMVGDLSTEMGRRDYKRTSTAG